MSAEICIDFLNKLAGDEDWLFLVWKYLADAMRAGATRLPMRAGLATPGQHTMIHAAK